MAITNRDLPPGTTLVAKFKKQDYACEVVQTDDGSIRFRYGGKDFTSPSAAGSAVMGGTACNGWRSGMELHRETHTRCGSLLPSDRFP